jgi:integrase
MTGRAECSPSRKRGSDGKIQDSNHRSFGLGDKALILIGFAAALRRSELVALTLADVERAPDGIVLHTSLIGDRPFFALFIRTASAAACGSAGPRPRSVQVSTGRDGAQT